MRQAPAAVAALLPSAGGACAGVAPNQGNQSPSGAKVEAPSREQDKPDGEQSAERSEAPKEDKR